MCHIAKMQFGRNARAHLCTCAGCSHGSSFRRELRGELASAFSPSQSRKIRPPGDPPLLPAGTLADCEKNASSANSERLDASRTIGILDLSPYGVRAGCEAL